MVKTQKALSLLKDRIQQIGLGPSPGQLKAYEVYKQYPSIHPSSIFSPYCISSFFSLFVRQVEIEQRLQQKMEKTVEEIQHQASEEKQRILLDATKQMRDALKDMSTQSNSKEVSKLGSFCRLFVVVSLVIVALLFYV